MRSRTVANDRGAVLLFVLLGIIAMTGLAGVAVDLGRAYIYKAHLAKAADAAALAGVRAIRLGPVIAQQHAQAMADVNSVPGMSVTINLGTNEFGEQTVEVATSGTLNTLFANILGFSTMSASAVAEAASPPVDMTLVIDQSGSLGTAGAWDDLQDAAKAFVGRFDDSIDQLGLVSFHTRAVDREPMGHYFTTSIQSHIDGMGSHDWTNTDEGLRFAYLQMQGPQIRERAIKVVVFFTDGHPTAFRDDLGPPGDVQDRIMAGSPGSNIAGYWDDPDALPFNSTPNPDGCRNVSSCWGLWDTSLLIPEARGQGAFWANQIRTDEVYVYTIGLGNPNHPTWAPDLTYLSELANVGGMVDPSQPQGKMYFAPSADELDEAFDALASDLFARLAR